MENNELIKVDDDLIWGSRVVFFGEANQGKSSIIGYVFAKSQQIDMERHKNELREYLGSHFKLDYLYSSLINEFVVDVASYDERYRTKRCHLRDFLIEDTYPIVITLIDTPGQLGGRYRRARSNQEYGISKGKIGVFCLSIEDIQDENFNSKVFNRTNPWRAFHKNCKLIIAITKFDRVAYSEKVYNQAVKKIHKCIDPLAIAEIIPVAIDFEKHLGANIFELSANMDWYKESTLIEAIKKQYFNIANNTFDGRLPNDLVFSIDREFPYPRSNAGKVWRVFIENGCIQVGTQLLMTCIKSDRRADLYGTSIAKATVKEFKIDLKINEDAEDADIAYKGTSLSINLKDCYIDGSKVNKREIETTDQTIGLASDAEFEMCRDFFVEFDRQEDVLMLRSLKQEIQVFVFGRGIPASITEIPDDLSGVSIQTLGNRHIVVPTSPDLRKLDIFRNVVIRVPVENDDFEYLPAKLRKI